jgi:acetyl-CoA acyltransferase
MRDAVIVDAVRTACGTRNGALRSLRPDDMIGGLISHLVNDRLGIDAGIVDDFVCGCVTQIGEQGLNVARNALLAGGLPSSLPGTTISRLEGSGQQALAFASHAVLSGDMDTVIAGGVESMSRQPMGADGFGDHVAHLGSGISPRLFERFGDLMSRGVAAEAAAERWGFTREELDAFAKRSHELASAAMGSGFYESTIMPVGLIAEDGSAVLLREDEGVRHGITQDELSSLDPAFKPGGLITAGNSGQAADGAAALVVMAAERCSQFGLAPKARYVCTATAGGDPFELLTGAITATSRALAIAGLHIEDIDIFEINESFAPVPLALIRELAPPRPERVNVWGGAIANGNPLGASGIKMACTMISALERLDGRYGLIVTCTDMGMGIATILERIA